MKIAINKTHWPVTVLGYGNRVGIWLQGCSIGCKGCCSTDTWETHPENLVEISNLISWVDHLDVSAIDGFTISGGEPFDQPQALEKLLNVIKQRYCHDSDRDIIVYSGYRFKKLQSRFSTILNYCDMVISEPFVRTREPSFLRGSNNQKFHFISDIAHERYTHASLAGNQKTIQTDFDGESLLLIGIPQSGDLERMGELLQTKGITLGST